MNSKELLEKYPKAAEVIKKYFVDQLLASVEATELPDEFKDFARQQGVDDDAIAGIINSQPRGCFDVFDQHQLYIGITPTYTLNGDVVFKYTIATLISGEEKTRKEAEATAVELAFKLLNEQL